jgi:23S rRNA (cytosine1962-C5)-methyltransferase
VDETFIAQRIAAAVALRTQTLRLEDTTTAWRVAHAEGDGLPGLIVDRFNEFAVVELFGLPMFQRLPAIQQALTTTLGVRHVRVRADERVRFSEGFTLPPPPDRRESTVVTENQVRFQVDLTAGHKTGFFCDQRENRLGLCTFTPDADVLDVCCYTGGFGIYAAVRGKARHVTALDLDEQAIALAQRNANLNHISRGVFETVHADSFPYLRQMRQNGRLFDTIVLDPPKFIPTREDFAEGRQKYFDLNRLALEVLKPGGTLLTCSCSGLLSGEDFFAMLRGAARAANRRVQVLRATGAGPDHPVMTDCPEGAYLKCLWCRV